MINVQIGLVPVGDRDAVARLADRHELLVGSADHSRVIPAAKRQVHRKIITPTVAAMHAHSQLTEAPPQATLIEMAFTSVTVHVMSVTAELGVFEMIGDRQLSAAELAATTGWDTDALHRVLRFLRSTGVLDEPEPGRYTTTPVGDCLRADLPGSMRSWLRMTNGPLLTALLGARHSIRTGEPSDRHVLGAPIFEYLAAHPEEAQVFDGAMTELSRLHAPAITSSFDFSGRGRVVDVGGGQGHLLAHILAANPQLTGVLFDQPHVVAAAEANFEREGVGDRCEVVAGDFFAGVPAGDTYLLSWIIHDWADEQALTILRNCRAAMSPGGRVILVESVLPEDGQAHFGKALDMFMMVIGGRERTRAEYTDLLARAGLRLLQVVTVDGPAPLNVLEAEAL